MDIYELSSWFLDADWDIIIPSLAVSVAVVLLVGRLINWWNERKAKIATRSVEFERYNKRVEMYGLPDTTLEKPAEKPPTLASRQVDELLEELFRERK